MPSSEDLLFGKIAVARHFCTQEQIDECALIQSHDADAPPLGELLLYKGYLTAEQHEQVMAEQKKNLGTVDPDTKQTKRDILLGRLAVKEGLLTQEQLNECLRLQGQSDEARSLGEIMVSLDFVTADAVEKLLSRQNKRIMHCASCRLSFTVLSLSRKKDISCPRCKQPLTEGKPAASTRVDAEFSTQIIRSLKPSQTTVSRGPAAKPVKVKCVICDSSFQGHLDPTGRIRCPECNSTFTPR